MRATRPSRPFVTANFALTWDGKVSTKNLTPADFSSPTDKHRLLEIRASADAILAGAGTIAADHMSMGLPAEELQEARIAQGRPPFPTRVIVSNSGRIEPTLRVFAHDFSPIHIFSTQRMPKSSQLALAQKATLHLEEPSEVDLVKMLMCLSELGIDRVVCEGGPTLFRSLLAADLIDQCHLTLCPKLFGGKSAPTLTGPANPFLPQSLHLKLEAMEILEGECFLRYGRAA